MKSAKCWLLAIALSGPGMAQADERDLWMFAQWAGDHENRSFREMLVDARLYGVVPIHQLLRSASDWRLCKAAPFAVPPASHWPAVRSTLVLIKLLGEQGALRQFEVVSAYRDPRLNACAGGAPSSAHMRAFAVDLLLPAWADPNPLCRFWQQHGQAWNMGLGRYPSGRIHLDTAGYRTWGGDGSAGSSFCSKPS
ncbi:MULTISPECIES: D-Ala-D-Ala carboxypeptidase family metallohydrolase [unclassified Pseudomonas]|uniref:D-Ala-D-Ala carboxypeptidase family metallohydrolase n=1 Tax=unclassified Pseudomonas TaxID=196821 RepID=UPI0020975FDC|nr:MULTISPECIES: D-Ala-D-Ala carboxypeptidase family metallohydrolase [unclassified Pseudomonas]MCO7522600.1 D-Ala-D-Ala carboxypeptidase family metallohydrolase [Pseudomonas sp. 1]MCO7538552.1 D-Ala-D-Ala carboxypeptidase family metallohydrolase [Pseudomonas sp. VA159-2]